ncbi:MAG: class I SAM-dependent methyltransferase [Anaerolineaceae bacterium]|nr:class I SAM-dependent methyltransferase [Anaerolineaceae bacterium]
MHISDAYTQWAATYDTDHNLTRDLDATMTRQALSGQRYGAALELGCGTGKNTALLANISGRVYALDFSEGMLAQAKAKIKAEHVQFTLADLTQPWPCSTACVELVVCNLVLEHIRDLDFIFEEAGRVLAEGGQFYISELHPFKQYQGKKAVFQRGGAQTEIPAFVHHISDFVASAQKAGFALTKLGEWWHDDDPPDTPRLVTFLFTK